MGMQIATCHVFMVISSVVNKFILFALMLLHVAHCNITKQCPCKIQQFSMAVKTKLSDEKL